MSEHETLEFPSIDAAPVRVSVCGRTDTGRRRADNQDSLLIGSLGAAQADSVQSPDADTPAVAGDIALGDKGAFLLVADGMGGAAAGAVASRMAVAQVHEQLVERWTAAPATDAPAFAVELRAALEFANGAILAAAQRDPACFGMGTTATLAGLLGDTVYVAQVGDSRAYLVRDGVAIQITRDQSVVQELVDAGTMTEEEAERSPHSNRILQALGAAPSVTPVLTHQQLRRRDVLILCSDGLTRVVGRDEIAAAVVRNADDAALCQELIDLANARGGPDNITVIVARVDGGGLQDASADDVVTRTTFTLPPVA